MSDILGPASQYAVTARPGRTNFRGPDDTWFKDCSSDEAEDGTILPSDWLNDMLAQFRTAFTGMGISLDNADDMLLRAIQSAGLRFAAVTGTANALIAAFSPVIPGYFAGLPVLLKIATNNTGPVTVNADGKGARAITNPDGTALAAGDLKAGYIIFIVDDGTQFQLVAKINAAGSTLKNIRYLSTSGTWNKPIGLVKLRMREWAAGGAGGAGYATSPQGQGGGGGAGEFAEKLFDAADLSATENYTIGAAGVGNNNNALPGGDAGDTTFKGITVKGGKGGSPFYATPSGYTRGGDGGTGGSGAADFRVPGGPGSQGGHVGLLGHGGGAFGGAPNFQQTMGVAPTPDTMPSPPQIPGTGGRGGWMIGMAGQNGSPSLIILEEYGV